MTKYVLTIMVAGSILALSVGPVQAFDCPNLVKACEALIAKMEKKSNVDKDKVADAKEACEESLQLHKAGDHKDSVIKAGEAISMAGDAAQ